jgi:hypothetical protein
MTRIGSGLCTMAGSTTEMVVWVITSIAWPEESHFRAACGGAQLVL